MGVGVALHPCAAYEAGCCCVRHGGGRYVRGVQSRAGGAAVGVTCRHNWIPLARQFDGMRPGLGVATRVGRVCTVCGVLESHVEVSYPDRVVVESESETLTAHAQSVACIL